MASSYHILQPIGTIITGSMTLGDYVEKMFYLLIGVAGVLAVVMLVICGIKLMMSEGAGGREAAKKCIWAAIFGLLIAISAWLLLNTINPQLVSSTLTMDVVTINTTGTEAEGTTAATAVNEAAPTAPGWYLHYQEGTSQKYKKFKPNDLKVCAAILGEMKSTPGVTILAGGPNNVNGCFEVGGSASTDEAAVRGSLCGEARTDGCLPRDPALGIQIDEHPCANPGVFETGCTTLAGLDQSAINTIKTLPGFCGGCTVLITGGTETATKNNSLSFDLRLSVGDPLYKAILASGPSEISFNGNRRWLINGFWFTDDQTTFVRSWHVCKDGANDSYCMPCGEGNTLCPPVPPPTTGGGGGGSCVPPPPPVCGATPSGTVVKSLDWAALKGNTIMDNPGAGTIAYKFTPTSESDGQLSIIMTGGGETHAMKTLWLTECPGDKTRTISGVAAVPGDLTTLDTTGNRCAVAAFEAGVIDISSRNPGTTVKNVCNLQVGKTYYANVKNAQIHDLNGNSCEYKSGTGCTFYRGFKQFAAGEGGHELTPGVPSAASCVPPPPPPTGTACGATPSGTVVKTLDWNSNTGNSIMDNPKSGTIAYKTTPTTSRTGDFVVAFTGGEKATKVVIITECPGALTDPVAAACSAQGFEVGLVTYTSGSVTSKFANCHLDIGKTYYINVKNATLGNLSGNTCESGTNCSFFRRFR